MNIMKNKLFYVSRLISTMCIFIFLIILFFCTSSLTTKIILFPFLLCSFASMMKNICGILEKEKYVSFFSKVYVFSFFLYWFGFLIYFDFISFIQHKYSLLFFSILFWISGIRMVKKTNLFGGDKK